jgi:Zn-dependent peptidase ImmA (M78 family)
MGTPDDRPLDPLEVARLLGVQVLPADRLVPRADLERLDALQPGAFSAATFHLPDGRRVAVYNPCNDQARTRSDVAHELAHLLLDHDVREVHAVGGQTFFTCDPEQEAEANWLAGCVLLPRALLLAAARRGATAEDVARDTGVTVSMARFRLNTSGVLLQARRARRPLSRSPGD